MNTPHQSKPPPPPQRMPAGPAPHSSAAQSNITRARSILCGRYAPSHAGHGGTLGASCCRTCRVPNISPKILWKCPAVGRAVAAARRAYSASGRPRRDARPRRPPRPGHAPRRRRRRPPPTSTFEIGRRILEPYSNILTGHVRSLIQKGQYEIIDLRPSIIEAARADSESVVRQGFRAEERENRAGRARPRVASGRNRPAAGNASLSAEEPRGGD